MILDIIIVLVLISGFYHGYKKGLIFSVLSIVGFIVGITLALKFSSVLVVKLSESLDLSPQILGIIAFILIVLATVAIFKLLSVTLERILSFAQLNFVNKIAGGVAYSLISLFIASLLFWFVSEGGFIKKDQMKSKSISIDYLDKFAPIAFQTSGKVIPFIKDSLEDIKEAIDKAVEKRDGEQA